MRLHAVIVDKVADDMLTNLICKYAHKNPNNVDRIREAVDEHTDLAARAEQLSKQEAHRETLAGIAAKLKGKRGK